MYEVITHLAQGLDTVHLLAPGLADVSHAVAELLQDQASIAKDWFEEHTGDGDDDDAGDESKTGTSSRRRNKHDMCVAQMGAHCVCVWREHAVGMLWAAACAFVH